MFLVNEYLICYRLLLMFKNIIVFKTMATKFAEVRSILTLLISMVSFLTAQSIIIHLLIYHWKIK